MATAYINDGLGNHQIDGWIWNGRSDKSVKQELHEIGSEQQQQQQHFMSKYAKHFKFTEQILHPKLQRTMKC